MDKNKTIFSNKTIGRAASAVVSVPPMVKPGSESQLGCEGVSCCGLTFFLFYSISVLLSLINTYETCSTKGQNIAMLRQDFLRRQWSEGI